MISGDEAIFSSATSANFDYLHRIAEESGGEYFNLLKSQDEEVVSSIGRTPFNFMGVEFPENSVSEVLPARPVPVHGAFLIVGKLLSDEAEISVKYGRNGIVTQCESYNLKKEGALSGNLLAHLWAQKRLAVLKRYPKKNKKQIAALGKKFGMVTPETSLLVLDSLDQYVEFRIPPPSTLPEMREKYFAKVAKLDAIAKQKEIDKIKRVISMWENRMKWWERKIDYRPYRKKSTSTNSVSANTTTTATNTNTDTVRHPTGPADFSNRGGSGRSSCNSLEWLKSVQNRDGSWGKEDPKLIPDLTAVSILAFLSHGETPSSADDGIAVLNGLKYLVHLAENNDIVKGDENLFSHPLVTCSLSEAYSMTHVRRLVPGLVKSINTIIAKQNPDGTFSLGYKEDAPPNLYFSAINYEALKSALVSGCHIPGLDNAIDKSIDGLREVFFKNEGFSVDGIQAPTPEAAATATFCLQSLGAGRSEVAQKGFEILKESNPPANWNAGRGYSLYNLIVRHKAFFNHTHGSGSIWREWNSNLSRSIAENQQPNGSWNIPEGSEENDIFKGVDRSIYATGIAALATTVYYRYLPTFRLSRRGGSSGGAAGAPRPSGAVNSASVEVAAAEEADAHNEDVEVEVEADGENVDASTVNDVTPANSALVMPALHGSRTGSGRRRALMRYGGSTRTARPDHSTFNWLKDNQNEDGSWGEENSKRKTSLTALALWTFLAYGEMPSSPNFGETVLNAVKYLDEIINTSDGIIKEDTYAFSHPMVVYALAETYILTRIPVLEPSIKKGIAAIIANQNPDGTFSPGYKKETPADINFSTVNYYALSAAFKAGLRVPHLEEAIDKSVKALKEVFPKDGGFSVDGTQPPTAEATAAGTLCLQFLGESNSEAAINGFQFLNNHECALQWETATGHALYLWYLRHQIQFQHFHGGGFYWNKWNKAITKMIIQAQKNDGTWAIPPMSEEIKLFKGKDATIYATTITSLFLSWYYPPFRAASTGNASFRITSTGNGDTTPPSVSNNNETIATPATEIAPVKKVAPRPLPRVSGNPVITEPEKESKRGSVLLKPLRSAAPRELYAEYLKLRKKYSDQAWFYLDAATIFKEKGKNELAIKAISNLAELKLDNAALLRKMAYKLIEYGELDLAITTLERVEGMRPEEPQSFRDLALAFAKRARRGDAPKADYKKAIDLLYKVVTNKWDRFEEIELIALMELNEIIPEAEKAGVEKIAVNPKLIKKLPLDLRIALTWDADMTDIDLWVIEPSGEKVFYSHKHSRTGAHFSKDFTNGYGPEEYIVKNAIPGTYTIQANYFGTSSPEKLGPVTVKADIFTNYGKKNETHKTIVKQLGRKKELINLGKVIFAPESGPAE